MSAGSARRTGLPSAVDGAKEAEGTLVGWKNMGGKEVGKEVCPGLEDDAGSATGGPAVGDGCPGRGDVVEEEEEGEAEDVEKG